MSKKMLIVFYSWSNGNTERIAKMIQETTGADMVQIDTVVPYTGSYDDVVRQGQEEVQRGYKPEIKPLDVDIRSYDVIAVGTPTWWYTMAPAVLTFLHQQDWNGKIVVPFQTHGGWPGHVLADIAAACHGAKVTCNMQVKFDSNGGDHMETPEAEVEAWTLTVKGLL
ncbi:flavodoxin [Anaeromassilibacillus sp. An200]|uniref:flavodoxin n=1 Tax=Anaeromassilibacillus sp. An200 TaxID=1965587 RepID=UPI000B3A7881|nr:flavodoxin [Anaeromassilibacillus sp. An200]OUP04119.1 flavodoxin [Anaeromassilibacillus sp. An200]